MIFDRVTKTGAKDSEALNTTAAHSPLKNEFQIRLFTGFYKEDHAVDKRSASGWMLTEDAEAPRRHC
jgi:hypothetical protein